MVCGGVQTEISLFFASIRCAGIGQKINLFLFELWGIRGIRELFWETEAVGLCYLHLFSEVQCEIMIFKTV